MPLSCEHTQHKLIFMTPQCRDQKLKGLATHSHKNYPTFVLNVFVFTFVLIIGTVCYTKQVIFKHNHGNCTRLDVIFPSQEILRLLAIK